MLDRKTIVLITFVILFAIEVSQQLFSEPDLSNSLIPLSVRQLCGYRSRPHQRNITFNEKCFMHSFKVKVEFVTFIPNPQNKEMSENRVLGGKNVQYREAPWVIQLAKSNILWGYSNICSGVLITMRHILTAAHCHPSGKNYIFLGNDKSFSAKRISGDDFDFIPHPDFIRTSEDGTEIQNPENDIAVIRLHTPLNLVPHNRLLELNTICLPLLEKSRKISFFPQDATFFGWGRSWNNKPSESLQKSDIQVKYEDKERKFFWTTYDTSPRTCAGDSGGGLLQYTNDGRAVLIGTLRGAENRKHNPDKICDVDYVGRSIFVRVVQHIDWIYKQLANN